MGFLKLGYKTAPSMGDTLENTSSQMLTGLGTFDYFELDPTFVCKLKRLMIFLAQILSRDILILSLSGKAAGGGMQ